MKKEYKPSGSAGGVPLEPSWPFSAQLQFLDPFLKHRPTTSNLQVTSYGFKRFSTTLQTTNEDSFVNLPHDEIETLSSGLRQTSSPDRHPIFSPILSPTVSIDASIAAPSPSSSIPANTVQTGKSKKRRMGQEDTSNELPLQALKESNDFIAAACNRQEPDEDDLFGQSVGKQLKKLSEYQKSLAKIKIQQVIMKLSG
eukprot:gene5769-11048_t